MKIQSKFMTGLVSRIVKKVLRTKLSCEVDIQLNEFRTTVIDDKLGYFHRWEQWSKVVDASPLRGGHPGGQNGQVFGIVEFEDGVRRVGPSSIKFCDDENAILCEMAKHHEELRRGEANAES